MKPEQFIRESSKLVYGVGVNDWVGTTYAAETGGHIPEYRLWHRMLERTHCKKYQERNPSYRDSTVDPNWLSFTSFINDVSSLKGYSEAITEGWNFDKDIICKGNKHYSLERCCFVPKAINVLITNNKAKRGIYPIGVCFHKRDNKFQVSVKEGNRNKHIGSFNNPTDAFYAYKAAKEAHIKAVANEWKERIDPRVYEALMSYTIDITD